MQATLAVPGLTINHMNQDAGTAGRRGLTRVVAGVRGLGIRDAEPAGKRGL